jgi:hypothetical protein
VSIFSRNTSNGNLTEVGVVSASYPWGICISNDGLNVYVTNYYGNSIYFFNRNPSSGLLTFNEDIGTGINPNQICISSDSQNVYANSFYEDLVYGYNRNILTGELVSNGSAATESLPTGICIYPTTFTPATPTALLADVQPSGVVSGDPFTTQPTIKIVDSNGNLVPTATNDVDVSITVVNGSGSLSGTTTVTAVDGYATFTDLVFTGAGSFYLTFTSTGLTPVISNEIATLTPAALLVYNQPIVGLSGQTFTTNPVIKIVNWLNELVPDATNDVDVALVDVTGSSVLTGTLQQTASSGYASFSDLVPTGYGSFYLLFSSDGLVSIISNTLSYLPDPGNPNPPIPVKPKRSYIPESVPTSGDMEINEFAINVADKKGYVCDSNGVVHLVFDGNASGTGTVTSVGLTSEKSTLTISNSPITTSGSIKIDLPSTGVSANSYTNADITVDVYGRITKASNGEIANIISGTGISVTGTYPDFTINSEITQYTDSDSRKSISAGTGISYDNTTGIITNDAPDQTVSLTGGTDISVTGTYPDFTIDFDGNTSYLPLSGGTMTGSITSFGTTHDTEVSGDFFGVQLSADHTQGTMINFDGLDTYSGSSHMKVIPTGLTFPDATTQTTAYTGGAGVSSIIAGTGISVDAATGDVTITNEAPDQTVSLTDGTGISVTGTYPDFTITNSAPDQTVSLTNGTGISVTGTYPDFTIESTITQYTDSDARKSISAGTGISYDNATGIITNDAPDQTVSLTEGTDITITGTYPDFTIAYSGTPSGGTVTSIGITTTATSLSITSSPITTSGDIGINFSGTGSEYVTGDGGLKTFPTTIDQALNLVTEVYNETGSTLTKGTVVYINGGHGNLPTITKAQANSDANSAQTYGIVQSNISDQDNGYVVVSGRLIDIDTQVYSAGTQLYLSPTTAGAWTSTKPSAPSHLVYVGIVVRSHPTQGVVEVKIQNGYELDEIHDVSITSVADNNILQYNSSNKLWENVAGTTKNISEDTNLYYTDSRARLSLSAGTSISYDNSTGVITNSDPDQVVSLTGGTDISVTGTYPSFTIDYTGTGGAGTVTSITAGNYLTGGTITSSGTIDVDATSSNTASKVVARDSSGDFSAGTITANLSGNASTVTTNANLTGVITSSGNTTSIASQTGTGSKFVVDTSPTILTPTLTGLKETKTAPSISSGTLALDCSVGNVFAVSLNANITTLSFTNVPSTGTAFGLTLAFTVDGTARTVTWGGSVKWPSATAPTLTSSPSGKVDIFVLTTWDGGTTWYAMIGGQNL